MSISEAQKKAQKIYNDKNKEQLQKYRHTYYLAHKEVYSKGYDKTYYLTHKEEYKKARVKYRKNNPWIKHLTSARRRCKYRKSYIERGTKCDLTITLTKKLWFRDKAYNLKKPSIDRINNNGHYTYENCRFIEHYENLIKFRD